MPGNANFRTDLPSIALTSISLRKMALDWDILTVFAFTSLAPFSTAR